METPIYGRAVVVCPSTSGVGAAIKCGNPASIAADSSVAPALVIDCSDRARPCKSDAFNSIHSRVVVPSFNDSSAATFLPNGAMVPNNASRHASRVAAASPLPHIAGDSPHAAHISLLATSISATNGAGGFRPEPMGFTCYNAAVFVLPIAGFHKRHAPGRFGNVGFQGFNRWV